MKLKPDKEILEMKFYNCDCMDLLAQTPDNYYELAIVDPPYGIGADKNQNKLGGKKGFVKGAGTYKKYHTTNWDNNIPNRKYFDEIGRVSKNQIIWGGNYFFDVFLTGIIIWYKGNSGNFKEGELAKTSFNTFKIYRYSRADAYINDCPIKIHPTQKPVALYKWLLKNYAKEGDKILDTHLGSMSIAIAVYQMNTESNMKLTLTGCELDEEFFNTGIERVNNFTRQNSLFDIQSLT